MDGAGNYFRAAAAADTSKRLFLLDPELPVEEAVEVFHGQIVPQWEENPPGLRDISNAIVTSFRANDVEISGENQQYIKAIHEMAERAEEFRGDAEKRPKPNLFHNIPHTGHVAIWQHYIDMKSGAERDPRVRFLKAFAAFAHDTDHPGGNNGTGGIFELEQIHYAAAEKIMKGNGFSSADTECVKLMILGTSINGGAQFVKLVAAAQLAGSKVGYAKLKEQAWENTIKAPNANKEEFMAQLEELSQLCENYPDMAQHAVELHAADTAPSWTSFDGCQHFGALLTEEYQARNVPGDFRSAGASAFFLGAIIGRGMFELPSLQGFAELFETALDDAGSYVAMDQLYRGVEAVVTCVPPKVNLFPNLVAA
ncbi:MAG: hypothetical protein ACPGRX_01975 [Bdellovibrionales bacterium]